MFNYSDTFYIVYYIMINDKLSERVISKKNTKYLLENTKHYPSSFEATSRRPYDRTTTLSVRYSQEKRSFKRALSFC